MLFKISLFILIKSIYHLKTSIYETNSVLMSNGEISLIEYESIQNFKSISDVITKIE